MSDHTSNNASPDGSTDITKDQQERTANLADGSNTGNATEDPNQDSDINSGGEPATPEKDAS